MTFPAEAVHPLGLHALCAIIHLMCGAVSHLVLAVLLPSLPRCLGSDAHGEVLFSVTMSSTRLTHKFCTQDFLTKFCIHFKFYLFIKIIKFSLKKFAKILV